MTPLKNFKELKRGYKFGSPTFYSSFHLGTDLIVKTGTKIYAPFDGKVTLSKYLPQGGNTIWFEPKDQNVLIRFLHNSEIAPVGKYKEGDRLGKTGNTGNRTTGPHLHLDISKDKLILSNYKNFIDPDKFDWGTNSNDENMYNVKSVLKNEIQKITKDDYGKVMAENEQVRASKQLKKFRKECESMQPLVDEDAIVSEIEQLRRENAVLQGKLDGQSSKIQSIKDYIKKLFV